MRGRTSVIVRAGLFLLFSILLVGTGPLQAAASDAGQARSAQTDSKWKPETNEHRDTEKLRDRSSSTVPSGRRLLDGRASQLPAAFHPATTEPGLPSARIHPAGGAAKPHHDWLRSRHSPAALQVYRN